LAPTFPHGRGYNGTYTYLGEPGEVGGRAERNAWKEEKKGCAGAERGEGRRGGRKGAGIPRGEATAVRDNHTIVRDHVQLTISSRGIVHPSLVPATRRGGPDLLVLQTAMKIAETARIEGCTPDARTIARFRGRAEIRAARNEAGAQLSSAIESCDDVTRGGKVIAISRGKVPLRRSLSRIPPQQWDPRLSAAAR